MSKITELPKAMIWTLLKVSKFSGNVLAPLTSQINGPHVNVRVPFWNGECADSTSA